MPENHGNGRDCAQETGQKPDGKIDVADDDDQGHAHRQHRDVAGLVQQIADVAG